MNAPLLAPAVFPQGKPQSVPKANRKSSVGEAEQAPSGVFTCALERASARQAPQRTEKNAHGTIGSEKTGARPSDQAETEPSAGDTQAGLAAGFTALVGPAPPEAAMPAPGAPQPLERRFPGAWEDPGPRPAIQQPLRLGIDTFHRNPADTAMNPGAKAAPERPAPAGVALAVDIPTVDSPKNVVKVVDVKVEPLNTGGQDPLADARPALAAIPDRFSGSGPVASLEADRLVENRGGGIPVDLDTTTTTQNGSEGLDTGILSQAVSAGPPAPPDTVLGRKEAMAVAQPHIIDQIARQVPLRVRGERSEITLELEPESLGRIHMTISTENQQVVVKMMAQTPLVKEVVEANLQLLRDELARHGLRVDQFDVSNGAFSDTAHFTRQDRGERFSGFERPDVLAVPVEPEPAASLFSEKRRVTGGGGIDYFA